MGATNIDVSDFDDLILKGADEGYSINKLSKIINISKNPIRKYLSTKPELLAKYTKNGLENKVNKKT